MASSGGAKTFAKRDSIGIARETINVSAKSTVPSVFLLNTSVGYLAPKFLVFGCIAGITSFFLVCVVVMLCHVKIDVFHTINDAECEVIHPLPSTVSDLVHNWNSVIGRLFTGLSFVSGLSIFVSSYGYVYRNSFSDKLVQVPRLYGLLSCWNNLFAFFDMRYCDVRSFIVPVGLLLVALVPTVRAEQGWTEPRLLFEKSWKFRAVTV